MEDPIKVQIGDRSQGKSCWERSTYGGSFISSNHVGPTVRSKCQFCMKNVDFVWKTPLELQIGDRSQGESYWESSTYGGSFI